MYEQAVSAYETALSLDPDNVDVYTSYIDLLSRNRGPIEAP
jgi:cytochrome c-type biogenesis protein CcmH/NrfG